jgi:predicted PurR-regulated permease PerM
MSLLKVTSSQRTILAVATVIALLIGVWFLRHYIMLVLFSALVVILFNPIYHWFLRKGRSPHTAAFYTMVISALAVIIPLVLVSIITFFQVQHLVNTIASGSYSHNVTRLATDIINKINEVLANTGISYRLTLDGIAHALSTAAQNFGKAFVGGLLSSVSGFFGFITAAIIYIYVFLSMIIHQDKILDTLKKLNPLGDTASNLYFERIGAMTKATVRGQFIIALCQGTESAAVLSLAGLNNLFFFFWMLLTVMSIIPLGAGIITIPIGIVMILTGNVWQGVLVIANHLIIVTNIDNVLRPRLVPRHARLDPALMILAVFAGLGMFGFFGIVLGPVLMIILLTTIQMYLEVFTETKSIDRSVDVKKPSLARRLQFWRRTES